MLRSSSIFATFCGSLFLGEVAGVLESFGADELGGTDDFVEFFACADEIFSEEVVKIVPRGGERAFKALQALLKELKEKSLFAQVKNEGYSIEWPNEVDLSSDTLLSL